MSEAGRSVLWCVAGVLLGIVLARVLWPASEATDPHESADARPGAFDEVAGTAEYGEEPGIGPDNDGRSGNTRVSTAGRRSWNERDAAFYRRRAAERRKADEWFFESKHDEGGDEGVAPSWNPYVPEALAPGGFEEQVRQAMEECEPDLDLLGFDCNEPPCLAIFRSNSSGASDVLTSEECLAWRESFGAAVTQSSDVIDCPDGASEQVLLIGSAQAWHWIDEPVPGDSNNGMKRLMARAAAVKEGWVCATGE